MNTKLFARFLISSSTVASFLTSKIEVEQLSITTHGSPFFHFLTLTVAVEGYSELVNPIQQLAAFEEQAKNIADGDEEAFSPDNDFVRAMEHGFPPISGVGVGVDRLASIIFDQPTLRDVILFPIMK